MRRCEVTSFTESSRHAKIDELSKDEMPGNSCRTAPMHSIASAAFAGCIAFAALQGAPLEAQQPPAATTVELGDRGLVVRSPDG